MGKKAAHARVSITDATTKHKRRLLLLERFVVELSSAMNDAGWMMVSLQSCVDGSRCDVISESSSAALPPPVLPAAVDMEDCDGTLAPTLLAGCWFLPAVHVLFDSNECARESKQAARHWSSGAVAKKIQRA